MSLHERGVFPDKPGRTFRKLFSGRARTRAPLTHSQPPDRRVSGRSRVVNANCRPVIGFFGRVVGPLRLPRRTTYPELRLR